MNKDNLPLILLALALIMAAVITFFRGGEKSLHGIGLNTSERYVAWNAHNYLNQLTDITSGRNNKG